VRNKNACIHIELERVCPLF